MSTKRKIIAAVVAVVVAALVRGPARPVGATTAKVPTTVIRDVPGWTYLMGAFALFGGGYSLFFYFLVTQFHPEFKSTPWAGHPLFNAFVRAALDLKKSTPSLKVVA